MEVPYIYFMIKNLFSNNNNKKETDLEFKIKLINVFNNMQQSIR